MGYRLKKKSKTNHGQGVKNLPVFSVPGLRARRVFTDKVKEEFYSELSILLHAGVTLKTGLELLRDNPSKKRIAPRLQSVIEALVHGDSFPIALGRMQDLSPYEFHSLKIGEASGTLPIIVSELSWYYAKKNEQKRQMLNSITYPVIVFTTALVVLVFMLRFVVPMFQDIFDQNNVELPWITQKIVGIATVFNTHSPFILMVVTMVVFILRRIWSLSWFKSYVQWALLKFPFVGPFLKSYYFAQFTRSMHLLVQSRLPLVESLQLSAEMTSLFPLRKAILISVEKILTGANLSTALKSSKLFDPNLLSLIKVAEETNKTGEIFEKLHQQYSHHVTQKSRLMTTLLEPFIILLVGLLVGIILVAMYLPMFKLSQVLG